MADVAPGWMVSLLAAYLVIWSAFGIALIVGVVFAALKIKKLVSRVSTQDAASDTFARPVAAVAAFVNGVCKGVAAGRAKRSD